MIKAIIKNLAGVETNTAKFATQQLATAWVTEQSAMKSFGKPERWVAQSQLAAEGEVQANAIDQMTEPTELGSITLFKFASEFTVEYVDVTAAEALVKKVNDRAVKRSFGEQMIDKISALNDSKSLTVEQVDAFMGNPLIASLREHLWAGNIDTFVAKLTAEDVSAFFSAPEKAQVISECQTFLTSLGA